jgi:acyl carrier protein
MDNFYAGLAEILEIDVAEVSPSLDLTQHAWDSLAIVSTIALLDECFGITSDGPSLGACRTVADIEALVARKRAG